ncbi:MAG: hypothetical protein RLZZ435_1488 [Cyanobacteriota bacterium]
MPPIPPLDLTQQYQTIKDEVEEAVKRVLSSGRYIGGEEVKAFETEFGQYIGSPFCVACNSGTDALYLALQALDLQPGDEVISTPFTFFATTEVISRLGAVPVFVDIDPQTLNLDLDQVEAAITPRTRLILPVHLFGLPLNMSRLRDLAIAHDLKIVEDCAQAIGAAWKDQKVGSWGDIGCFSFFPTKNLGACGDAGAIVTADPEIAQRIRQLREHGSPERYYHSELGLNSRLDALQAAILRIKLHHLDRWNQQRRQVADRYQAGLQSFPALQLPQPLPDSEPVWHQYTLRVKSCAAAPRCQNSPSGDTSPCDLPNTPRCRDWLKSQLADQGIQSMVYYPIPLHQQVVYQSQPCRFSRLPVAEQCAQEVLSLPMFPELKPEQQDQIIQALQQLLGSS